jgi:hypothetical protein
MAYICFVSGGSALHPAGRGGVPSKVIYRFRRDVRVSKQRVVIPFIIGGLLLAAVLAPGTPGAEKSVYRGRLFLGSGPTTQGVITVEITIDHVSTAEELAKLPPIAAGDVLDRFFEKARDLKAGDLRYIGANGLRIDFNLAFEQPTKAGKRILLVAENQPADPTVSLKRLSDAQIQRGLLLVVAIDLDGKDQGEGKIYQDASGTMTPEGRFDLVGSRTTPLLITGLRRK